VLRKLLWGNVLYEISSLLPEGEGRGVGEGRIKLFSCFKLLWETVLCDGWLGW